MRFSRISRRLWLTLAACLLSVGIFALTTQSRLCLYHGSTVIDHFLNKSTKTTAAKDKAEFAPQSWIFSPLVDLDPGLLSAAPLPLQPQVVGGPLIHTSIFFRPPPQFS